MNRTIDYTRPNLTAYQREIIDCPERFGCTEASSKAGKTSAMLIWLFEQALKCKENQYCYWVAPVFNQSKIAFDRMRNQVSQRNFFKVNESRLTLTMPHGSIIEFKSGDNPDTLYGNDCYAAVLDESSRMSEAVWIAIRSTLTATGGPCKLIGNVKGRKNFFYKMAMKAKNGEPNYFYKRITAYDAVDAGVLSMDEIESAKRDLPAMVFEELYMAVASDDGANPFGMDHIARCVQPMSTRPAVCFGVDVASRADWTVIIGLDQFGNVCYLDRRQGDWRTIRETIIALPPGNIIIDATGVGSPIAEEVARVRDVEMFIYTSRSKQNLMEDLAYAIQNGNITFPEGVIKDELESFEYVHTANGVKYSAPSGSHDDACNALALAVRGHKAADKYDGKYSFR